LKHIPENQYYDIIQCYRRLLQAGTPLNGHLSEGHRWWDIGNLESYRSANRETAHSRFLVGEESEIHPTSKLSSWAVIGNRVSLEAGSEIHRSILWDGVVVKKGLRISNSIITTSRIVNRPYKGEVF
jgi:mannose-1-phosphate guanylyltransferase